MLNTGRWLCLLVLLTHPACGRSASGVAGEPVTMDGSSTLYPLSEAVAEEFRRTNSKARVSVSSSGTREGLRRLCAAEVDIANASSPITVEEHMACAAKGVTYIELPVAHDAITIIVNPKNAWATSITAAELRTLWSSEADGQITRWSQVRAGWPEREILLFGPGTESGTYDYFTNAIDGRAGASRRDYAASADDDVIVKGVADNELALGYVGYTYFDRNRSRLKALALDDGDDRVGPGAIEPSPANVHRGSYRPLSRPLFLYVNATRAERPEVQAFVRSYLRKAPELAAQGAAIPLMATAYQLAEARFAARKTGTMFTAPESASMSVELLLTQ